VHTAVKGLSDLGVDRGAEPHDTAESRLDVPAGAAEALIEVEVTERRVEVVAPHQPDHPPSKPDTFRVSGRTVNRLGRLDELVGLALAFLGCVGRGRLFGGRVLGPEVTALSDCSPDPDKQSKGRNGDSLKNRNSKPGTYPKHEIPD